ncbi:MULTISPECIES: ferritin-like domain-containing protein [Methylococcus]|uniref:Ferritin-like domain-containing protein n=1 Tax=Methylococcus capsulatus TaxID=414 RepID=A0ABZ2F9N8_METCP|nr:MULTISPECIES: ferritin-like domain-containing protein [Methylococcus]MDF9391244.1 ferritin-like domain-containing protein [Methylococcus capsulatus]
MRGAGSGNIWAYAEHCLGSPEVETKLAVSHEAWRACRADELDFGIEDEPLPTRFARFPDRPPRVDPRDLPRRGINTVDGRVALLHAVAHIEFSAIQLAWDHLYRFRGLPQDYYRDWLRVAAEEAEHFAQVRERLRELGADYGDLPAHGGLWSIAEETAYDVAARMALVPRFMEARGLDVTPGMIERLRQAGDARSVAVLERILHDEVGHVALGSRWFQWICAQRGIDPEVEYFTLVERHLRGQARGPFNLELRRRAGFSDRELERLEASSAPRRYSGA